MADSRHIIQFTLDTELEFNETDGEFEIVISCQSDHVSIEPNIDEMINLYHYLDRTFKEYGIKH